MKNSKSLILEEYPNPYDSAWLGHIPFAHWLIELAKPSCFVELGVHCGNSYFSFCKSVVANKVNTKCFGIDTWRGDAHAGMYEEEIFEFVKKENLENFDGFSQLLKMTFDEALETVEDGTLDILHIDGLHTYEAVHHDFNSWLPKMSKSGIVLFHDIAVKRDGFGVWQLWEELSKEYPHIGFSHSNGLGVLFIGKSYSSDVKSFIDEISSEDNLVFYTGLFSKLGSSVELTEVVKALTKKVSLLEIERHEFELKNLSIEGSISWKLTSPLRFIKNWFRG